MFDSSSSLFPQCIIISKKINGIVNLLNLFTVICKTRQQSFKLHMILMITFVVLFVEFKREAFQERGFGF